MANAHWRPLLEGELARKAWQAIDAVAEELLSRASAGAGRADLFDGEAALALFFHYLALARPERVEVARARELCSSRAEGCLESEELWPTLFTGFIGVAWALQHLEEEPDPERFAPVDELLLEHLRTTPPRPGEVDLVSGTLGLLPYALEALPRPEARELLGLLLTRLEQTAEQGAVGRAWRTLRVSAGMPAIEGGWFNLGMAHGLPGGVSALAALAERGLERERCERLAEAVISEVLAHKLPAGGPSSFAIGWGKGATFPPARCAWCYGDPGVAIALLRAGLAFDRPEWRRTAHGLMRAAAERTLSDAGVGDACLCHGTAGLAHLFNRFHQATGEPLYAEAARRWLESTLRLRREGAGAGGFLVWTLDRASPGGYAWLPLGGLLEGASGVALALLAAVTPISPRWDRVFLLDVER